MLNRSGITKTSATSPAQILADVDLQFSVGCVVAQAVGTDVSGKKIAKAGTPLVIDFGNLSTAATKGTVAAASGTANAVLLHDVDVTSGNANGTALVFGFVNVNRMESDVQSLYTVTGPNVAGSVTAIKA